MILKFKSIVTVIFSDQSTGYFSIRNAIFHQSFEMRVMYDLFWIIYIALNFFISQLRDDKTKIRKIFNTNSTWFDGMYLSGCPANCNHPDGMVFCCCSSNTGEAGALNSNAFWKRKKWMNPNDKYSCVQWMAKTAEALMLLPNLCWDYDCICCSFNL